MSKFLLFHFFFGELKPSMKDFFIARVHSLFYMESYLIVRLDFLQSRLDG